jgi:hypothetical protein
MLVKWINKLRQYAPNTIMAHATCYALDCILCPINHAFFFETPINHAGILQCLGLDELVCMLSLVDMS